MLRSSLLASLTVNLVFRSSEVFHCPKCFVVFCTDTLVYLYLTLSLGTKVTGNHNPSKANYYSNIMTGKYLVLRSKQNHLPRTSLKYPVLLSYKCSNPFKSLMFLERSAQSIFVFSKSGSTCANLTVLKQRHHSQYSPAHSFN